jgi:tetratricopeptide (TPR) repeat protein
MIKPLRTIFVFILCSGLLTTSCNNTGKKEDDQAAAVLHQFPFAPLTDSLREAKGQEAASLYYRRGDLLSRSNHHELAADDYHQSWELHPDELTGLRYASTLAIIGQTDKAIKFLLAGEKIYPANPAFRAQLGELYQQSGRTKEALAIYDDMLHRDSLNDEAWFEKGLQQEKLRDTPNAIRSLGKAYGLHAVNTYGLELAHLYAESRNPVALSICDDVLRKDSAHELIDPLFIKGIYYSNTAQYKKAIVQFDSCIGRDWKFTDAYLEKGIALFEQKRYDSAMTTFLMTVKVSDTYPDGYYWVGRCYEATGHKDQAILYYREALALDKTFTEAADHIKALQ